MIIYLEDKRRELAQMVPKIQHMIAGVPLFFVGLSKLGGDAAEIPMAIVEILVAVGVLATFAWEARAVRHHLVTGKASHAPVGWFDLAAGGLLIFEAFHTAHLKPGYLRPQFLAGVSTLGVGLFHARLHRFHRRRHYLKVDESGLEYRRPPFRRLKLQWTDLASVDLQEHDAILHRKDGRRHKIGLKRFHNVKALRQGLADHAGPAGLLTESRL